MCLAFNWRNIYVFTEDEAVTAIRFNLRTKKILKKVEFDLPYSLDLIDEDLDSTDYELIKINVMLDPNSSENQTNIAPGRKFHRKDNSDSEEDEEGSQEDENLIMMDRIEQDSLHDVFYTEAYDSMVLVTEGCKIYVVKDVFGFSPQFPGQKRKIYQYTVQGMRWIWSIQEFSDNTIQFCILSSQYVYLELDLVSMNLKAVQLKQRVGENLSISPYLAFELDRGLTLFLLDDELITYDTVNKKVVKSSVYSACNYFEIHELTRPGYLCYIREDRRGMFVIKKTDQGKRLELVSKFHLDSNFTDQDGSLSALTRLNRLEKAKFLEK